jgi:hypothetical protein
MLLSVMAVLNIEPINIIICFCCTQECATQCYCLLWLCSTLSHSMLLFVMAVLNIEPLNVIIFVFAVSCY